MCRGTIVTVATLTGAAARAIGTQGIVAMGTADDRTFERLRASGDHVHERIAHFTFWKEYDKELDSDIADMKNLGSDSAGMITAGQIPRAFHHPSISTWTSRTRIPHATRWLPAQGRHRYQVRLLVNSSNVARLRPSGKRRTMSEAGR
ncbi:MAG: hypothetical protein IPL77_00140, partial [Flavobacteriales bacterium]|nr:hypothetical protein [Flavobacteriales bacterium]